MTDQTVYESIECEECGYKVFLKGQKMKPKYMMNAHKKTCRQKKRKRTAKQIIEYLGNATDEDVFKIFNYIKKDCIVTKTAWL
tara:strand:- start:145 stop:393 length:249 start_codon:yes stop_codon:yes gene_type:complete